MLPKDIFVNKFKKNGLFYFYRKISGLVTSQILISVNIRRLDLFYTRTHLRSNEKTFLSKLGNRTKTLGDNTAGK
jgi:hypothetical protein